MAESGVKLKIQDPTPKQTSNIYNFKRKGDMKRILAILILISLPAMLFIGCGEGQEAAQPEPQEDSHHLKCVFDDPTFSFELLRTMGEAVYGCSDIGECLTTAYQIEEGNIEDWYSEWYETAERVRGYAEQSLAGGHEVSAREAYLRAMNYYRTAEFYLHGDPDDPRILETWGKSRDCFAQAAELFTPAFERVEIPYEGTTLPGYFFKVDDSGIPRPTLIIQTGFDGTLEELYCNGAEAALRRGYNCLAFVGPGQGGVIREQGIPFRPDWENVVTPVVDYALTRSDIDPERMALMGISLGGYLAPRGASGEHRLAALIADGGVYYPVAGIIDNLAANTELPEDPEEFLEYVKDNPEEFDEEIEEAMKENTTLLWFMDNGMYTFDVDSPSEFILKYSEMTMDGHAANISCPTLVIDSESDDTLKGQPQELYDHLTCPKEFMLFTDEEGAGEHCQMGALLLSHQRIFDWLDQVFTQSD
jgi:pimeloyl-ACP methyl ester carboxylesterase